MKFDTIYLPRYRLESGAIYKKLRRGAIMMYETIPPQRLDPPQTINLATVPYDAVAVRIKQKRY